METFLGTVLEDIKKQYLHRELQVLESAQAPVVTIQGKRFIQFSSNNYLGLANHILLKGASKAALEAYGAGVGASRLIAGNSILYETLETRLAKFKRTEAALVFPTGYQANLGTISALMGPDDLIFSDSLNHASIIDGCKLSGSGVVVYPHRDLDALEKMVRSVPTVRHKLILTDGVFSMDGTIAPLPEIVALAKRYDCWVMVDDAHGTGVLGEHGRGSAEHFSVEHDIEIHMGTFSKALGSLGGYVAGSRKLIDFLINRCRSLIYSTGLPPAVLAANLAALQVVEEDSSLRQNLWEGAHFVRRELNNRGFDTFGSETQIIPVRIGDSALTMKFSRYLFERGVFAYGIRPPTVPRGLARIRIAVMATHSHEDLLQGVEAIEAAGKNFRVI